MMRRRPLLRAAAVGGAGYMAGRGAANRRAATAEQDARLDALEQQQANPQQGYPPQGYAAPPQQGYAPPPAAPSPAAPPAAESSMMDQLNQLAALHQQGVLSDEEFTAAKAKLLGT
jgi:hypothetical protein